jgi:hypothetical protein
LAAQAQPDEEVLQYLYQPHHQAKVQNCQSIVIFEQYHAVQLAHHQLHQLQPQYTHVHHVHHSQPAHQPTVYVQKLVAHQGHQFLTLSL